MGHLLGPNLHAPHLTDMWFHACLHACMQVQVWLENLVVQLVASQPSQPGRDLHSLPNMAAMLQLQDKVIQAFYDFLTPSMTSSITSIGQAVACRDAAMVAMLYGFVPTIRLWALKTCRPPQIKSWRELMSVGASLPEWDPATSKPKVGTISNQPPQQHSHPCPHPRCMNPSTCLGNRLELVRWGDQGFRVRAFYPHHKNQGRGGTSSLPIEYVVGELASSLVMWYLLGGARDTLLGVCDGDDDGDAAKKDFVFITTHSGVGLSDSSFSNWWDGVMRMHGPDMLSFCPSLLRHIFVGERTGDCPAPGPGHEGAAAAMGNSVRRWELSYVLPHNKAKLHVEIMQAAVEAMPVWRKAVLDKDSSASAQQLSNPDMASAANTAGAMTTSQPGGHGPLIPATNAAAADQHPLIMATRTRYQQQQQHEEEEQQQRRPSSSKRRCVRGSHDASGDDDSDYEPSGCSTSDGGQQDGGGGEGGMEEGEVQQVRGRVRPRTHGTVLRPSPAANGKHHGGTASSSLGTMAYQGLMRVFSWGSLWGGAPRGR